MAHTNGKRDPSIGEMFLATMDDEERAMALGRHDTGHQTGPFDWTPGGTDGYSHAMGTTLKRIDAIVGDPDRAGDPAAAVHEIRGLVQHLKDSWLLGDQFTKGHEQPFESDSMVAATEPEHHE